MFAPKILHLFSAKNKIPIYSDKELTSVEGYLTKGEWMGAVDENEDFYFVISSECVGWVRRMDCIRGEPMNMHVQYKNGRHYYVAF